MLFSPTTMVVALAGRVKENVPGPSVLWVPRPDKCANHCARIKQTSGSEKIRGALADHDRCEVGVGMGDRGHDRSVGNPQIFHAVNTQALVDDRHRVGGWPHHAGSRAVMIAVVGQAREPSPAVFWAGLE